MSKKFLVIVSGSVLDESDDELVAGAMAACYKGIGWKNVSVKPRTKKR